MSKTKFIGFLLIILMVSVGLSVVPVNASFMVLQPNSRITIRVDLSMFETGMYSITLLAVTNNSQFAGIDYTNVLSSVASGNVRLGLFQDKDVEKETPLEFCYPRVIYVKLQYIGVALNASYIIILSISEVKTPSNATLHPIPIFMGSEEVTIVQNYTDPLYYAIIALIVLFATTTLISIMILSRKQGHRRD